MDTGDPVSLFVRPEGITPLLPGEPCQMDNCLEAQVSTLLFDGGNSRIAAVVEQGTELTVRLPQTAEFARLRPGDRLQLGWMSSQAQYFAAGAQ